MRFQWLAASLCLGVLAAATPAPLPGSEDIVVRDPAIWYNADLGKYFVFATREGIKIYTAPSLKGSVISPPSYTCNLTSPLQPLDSRRLRPPNCSSIPLDGNCKLWAPDVNYINGEYVLYYSVSTIGSQNSAIGVATSPSMEQGTWTDLGEVIHSQSGDVYNAIDPNIIDDNGLKLAFGSYWNGMYHVGLSDIKTRASDLPGTHLAGGNGRAAEGGFVYRPQGSPYYFMFFSAGTTPLEGGASRPPAGSEYKVLVGRGDSAMGPFRGQAGHELTEQLDPPTGSLVLGSHDTVYAPGGQSVFLDPVSGRDAMVYHYVRMEEVGGTSYLGINYLDFSSGWPVVVDE